MLLSQLELLLFIIAIDIFLISVLETWKYNTNFVGELKANRICIKDMFMNVYSEIETYI